MNLLIIQTAFIGDVVLTTPLLQAAREQLGATYVAAVVRPDAVGVLYNNPAVDEIIPFDKKGVDRGLKGLIRLGGRLREKHFEAALMPHRSLRSALLAWLARIPVRTGFDTSSGRWLLTHQVPYQAVHEVERNLSLLSPLTSAPLSFKPTLYPDDTDHTSVDDLLKRHNVRPDEILFGISPGSVWATKRWLPDRFAESAKRLTDEHPGRVVLFGAVEDEALCRQIAGQSGVSPIDAAGQLSLLQSAALASRCTVMISNDTGMAHIAAAMDTPVISLFGPTVASLGFTPYGNGHKVIERTLSCRPCGTHGGHQCPISTHACMQEITVDMVMKSISAMIQPLTL
ncbi:MAG: lipopolysaccharide heptosyltransferase II [Candidatus Latescibacteria bacterium]|jgi:heptosyltransferase-2|nr:lipopolysaccharide heptosyltransferase II [Candidatus Latescibacterota bacterium]MDP7235523.1 lipopolysaccharide heptosyltransferase II [Candidatus Latescibacterota bacterium]